MSNKALLDSKTYLLDIPEGEHFSVSVKRYSLFDDSRQSMLGYRHAIRITLLLAHGLGLHKETWEPFLADLQGLQSENESPRVLVSEAWSIDCPTHGDSAIRNERKLVNSDRFNKCMDYSEAFLALLNSAHFSDRHSRNIVFVGHSAGALAAILAVVECRRRWNVIPFSSLIILEPPIVATPFVPPPSANELWKSRAKFIVELVNRRRDKWPSKPEAYAWLRSRTPYNAWNPRALESYVEHGLRDLPTLFYPDDKTGVTLKCYRAHESEPFLKGEEPLDASIYLEELKLALPVHLVFAENSFYRPSDQEIEHLANPKSSKFSSVSVVPNVDHFLVQDSPTATARAVMKALAGEEHACFPSRL